MSGVPDGDGMFPCHRQLCLQNITDLSHMLFWYLNRDPKHDPTMHILIQAILTGELCT